jgi:hypothetical protein
MQITMCNAALQPVNSHHFKKETGGNSPPGLLRTLQIWRALHPRNAHTLLRGVPVFWMISPQLQDCIPSFYGKSCHPHRPSRAYCKGNVADQSSSVECRDGLHLYLRDRKCVDREIRKPYHCAACSLVLLAAPTRSNRVSNAIWRELSGRKQRCQRTIKRSY